jgi:hypothetical protein
MIKLKLNLAAFQHAIMDVKKKDGTKIKAVVIPIEGNHIFMSEKGNLFVDAVAREIAADKRKGDDTHLISQNLKKEVYEALRAEGKYAPTLGSLQMGGGSVETPAAVDLGEFVDEADLPF